MTVLPLQLHASDLRRRALGRKALAQKRRAGAAPASTSWGFSNKGAVARQSIAPNQGIFSGSGLNKSKALIRGRGYPWSSQNRAWLLFIGRVGSAKVPDFLKDPVPSFARGRGRRCRRNRGFGSLLHQERHSALGNSLCHFDRDGFGLARSKAGSTASAARGTCYFDDRRSGHAQDLRTKSMGRGGGCGFLDDRDASHRYISPTGRHRPPGGGHERHVLELSVRASGSWRGVARSLRIRLAQTVRVRTEQAG